MKEVFKELGLLPRVAWRGQSGPTFSQRCIASLLLILPTDRGDYFDDCVISDMSIIW